MTTISGLGLQQNALAITQDGDVVVAGTAYSLLNPTFSSLMVARYEGGGDRGCGCGR